jgi:hypothetical protein
VAWCGLRATGPSAGQNTSDSSRFAILRYGIAVAQLAGRLDELHSLDENTPGSQFPHLGIRGGQCSTRFGGYFGGHLK